MKQQSFDLLTDFERITADQIAIYCGKDKPSDKDISDAVKLVNKWNKQRIDKGLKPWS